MVEAESHGDYKGQNEDDIKNRQNKRMHKTEDYADDNYNDKDYNHHMVAEISPAGHKFIQDNTPGKERLLLKSMNGTGFEILKDGTKIDKVTGNHYHYTKGGVNESVQGNADYKVGGHKRSNVEGGHDETVKGDNTQYVGGSAATQVVGNRNDSTTGGHNITSEKALVMTAKGQGESEAPVRISLGHDGTIYVTGSKHVVFQATEDYMINAPKVGFKCDKFSIDCSGDIQLKGGGDVAITADGDRDDIAGGDYNAEAGGTMNLTGAPVKAGPELKTQTFYANILPLGAGVMPGEAPAGATEAEPEYTDHFPEEEDGTKKDATNDTADA